MIKLVARDYRQFRVEPCTPTIGGTITGFHLGEIDEDTAADLRDALWTYGVLFARGQNLSFDAMKRVAYCFGDQLETHSYAPTMAAQGHPEVVVIERNPIFWSCPLSNKWLIDVVDTNFLVHSYMNPARKHGYTFIQAEVSDIDRSKRRVHTAQGHIDYDWLVIGSGFGGSVSALRLAEKGYTVGVLEAGRRFRDEDFAKTTWDAKNFNWLPQLGLRGILRLTPFKDVLIGSGAGVSGGSLVYTNTLNVKTCCGRVPSADGEERP